jgi:hypothetical protein
MTNRFGFIHFDDTCLVFEVFTTNHEWIGCFDTYREAIAELREYSDRMLVAEAEVDAATAKERRQLSGGR